MEVCRFSSPYLGERRSKCFEFASTSSSHDREEIAFCARADGAGVSPASGSHWSAEFRSSLVLEQARGKAAGLRTARSYPQDGLVFPRGTLVDATERLARRSRRRWEEAGRPSPWRPSPFQHAGGASSRVCSCVGVREGHDIARDQGSPECAFPGLPWPSGPKQMEQADEKVEAAPLRSERDVLLAHYVPVYVMLPLDAVTYENNVCNPELMLCNLRALKAAGVDGVMVDLWWGIVEKEAPKKYSWSAYQRLLGMVAQAGLKLQVVMSFHQCGGNTGDSCFVPLPKWVLDLGEDNRDIFFKNRDGLENQEYLSFGIDDEAVLHGRTAVQVYRDFMESFRCNFQDLLQAGVVCEIQVGLGPAGELRYPSYPETHGWKFPGIGEFQCYDKFLLRQLKSAAIESGQHDWGHAGPHDSGRYNDWPHATGFFGHRGFASDYGRFFLEWYSSVLVGHGDIILEKAADVFAGYKTKLAAKVAGVHWWYNSHNHAAELAAGYYNLRERDGYQPIAQMLCRHDATLIFTCAEMRNEEQQHVGAHCSPEGLVKQVLHAGWREGLEVACENALPRYDGHAFDQIIRNARPEGVVWDRRPTNRISSFTFLRLGPDLLHETNWAEFVRFVRGMHVGLDWHPEPELYFRPQRALRHSKPWQARQDKKLKAQDAGPASEAVPVASVPLDAASIPPPPCRGTPQGFFSWDAPGGGLGCHVEEPESQTPRQDGTSTSGPEEALEESLEEFAREGQLVEVKVTASREEALARGGGPRTSPVETNMMEFWSMSTNDLSGSSFALGPAEGHADDEFLRQLGAMAITLMEAWSMCLRSITGDHWH